MEISTPLEKNDKFFGRRPGDEFIPRLFNTPKKLN
jgi:hypothetical protein